MRIFVFLALPLMTFCNLVRIVEPSISYRFDSIKQQGDVFNITVRDAGTGALLLKPISLEKINRKIEDMNLAQVGLMIKWMYNDMIYLRLFGSYGKPFTDPREDMSAILLNNSGLTEPFVDVLQHFNQSQFAVDLEANVGFLLFKQNGWSFYPDAGFAYTIAKVTSDNQMRIYSFLFGAILTYAFERSIFSFGYHFYPRANRTLKIHFLNQTLSSGQVVSFEPGEIREGNTYGNAFFVQFSYRFAKRWHLNLKYHFLEYVTHKTCVNTFGGDAFLKNAYRTQKIEIGFLYAW
ncbi:MAG: hypothetical protein K940chlam8_00936 [Chlamydiae bacterium]|nr:hypothetical protein [Chlamydiota bacterium]